MDLNAGIFAFAQATVPIMTAIPLIVLEFNPPISFPQILTLYYSLVVYFVDITALGLYAILVSETVTQTKVIFAVGYFLLAVIIANMSIRIAIWVIQEQVTRDTRWNEELSEQDINNGSLRNNMAQRGAKKPSSRQGGRCRKK